MHQNEIIARKCPIVVNNGAVIVVKFDHIDVQLPYLHTTSDYLYVSYENGKYSVIDELKYHEIISKKAYVHKKKNTIATPVVIDGSEHVILENI